MNFDITALLDHWDYTPGQIVVRKFNGKDGHEKIQLRVDLGILQMNATGRPDGKRPFGHDSLLEHFTAQLEKHRGANSGNDAAFDLKAEDCAKLQQESIQYHHRYICLFQLKDYEAVIRDTERNIEVFDLVEQFAADDDLAWSLQQFRPQLLMMKTRAYGSLAVDEGDIAGAIDAIEEGIEELRRFYTEHNRQDLLEHSGEIQSLESWLQDIRTKRPMSEREKLESALTEAVQREDYEEAAKVRDALKNLNAQQT